MQTRKNSFLFYICSSVLALCMGTATVSAQQIEPFMEVEIADTLMAPEGFEYVDSLIYVPVAQLDSSYFGGNVFDVNVRQSPEMVASMREYLRANPSRAISGFRVRIFFDNKQTAKVESEKTLAAFKRKFRDVPAYRTYVNPYFKVTVGDCRTKSEAMALLGRIKKAFPSAFVVKENISFPVLDKEHVYDIDTIKVLRPLVQPEDASVR